MERKAKKQAENRPAVPSRSASFRYQFRVRNAHRNNASRNASSLLSCFSTAPRNAERLPCPVALVSPVKPSGGPVLVATGVCYVMRFASSSPAFVSFNEPRYLITSLSSFNRSIER